MHETERVLPFRLQILFHSHITKHLFYFLTHQLVYEGLVGVHERHGIHFEIQLVLQVRQLLPRRPMQRLIDALFELLLQYCDRQEFYFIQKLFTALGIFKYEAHNIEEAWIALANVGYFFEDLFDVLRAELLP